ncbi:MAG: lipopolysaccharide heptosyltransferase II [Myxococcota bacterium]
MSPNQAARGPERILVRGPNWLGDLVMSTPGFRALRRAYPRAKIVALVPATLAPLLAGSHDFDEIWPLRPRTLSGMRADARRIADGAFELGLLIPESISSALLMRWGRVGHITGYARDLVRRILRHQAVPAAPEWGLRRLVSKERFVLGLMEAVGAGSTDATLRLEVTPDEELRLGVLLRERGTLLDEFGTASPIVLAPGASYGESKCWPVASFAALADRLAARGERVLLIGTAAERDRLEAVQRQMASEAIDLGGVLDLGTLKALLRRTRLLVANDAGARHVAAAFDVPSVIFFGPTSVTKTVENLVRVEVLETEHGCRPCYLRECPIDHRCLTSIEVAEALAAIDRALNRPPSLKVKGAEVNRFEAKGFESKRREQKKRVQSGLAWGGRA